MNSELVLDLHLHSKYSRAVSGRMNHANMYLWGRKKGINILSVCDFTHPLWFREAKNNLKEVQEGVFSLKDEEGVKADNPQFFNPPAGGDFLGPYFIFSTEVSSIYSEGGQVHRIHNLIFAPNFEVAEKITREFHARGFNLHSDGRPTFGITTKNLMELLFSIDRTIALIPCHIWTPWFSLYGSRSGYDRLADCFGDYSKYIFAVETGLSSDPAMNWKISELESRSIVSFSDAHSLEKMGREATIITPLEGNKIHGKDITYKNILNSFVKGKERIFKIGYTIEFYPEEGKYHYTGHRNCGISYSPEEDKIKGTICPVCKKPLTVGVMHRVDELATENDRFTYEQDEFGVSWVKDKEGKRPKYVSLVPLLEILAESLGSGTSSNKVMSVYDQLVSSLYSEHEVLFRTQLDKIKQIAGAKVAEGIQKVRARNIHIEPGYDNDYGKVKIWGENTDKEKSGKEQMGLF